MGGSEMREKEDEAVSPAARFFLRHETDYVIFCIIAFEKPISVPSVKEELLRTVVHDYPRLKCLLVKDTKGCETWSPSPTFNIDDHVIVIGDEEDDGGSDTIVEDHVAALAVAPSMSRAKPMWELHIIPRKRTWVFRLHHSLGDGTSLMSLLFASCERVDDPTAKINLPGGSQRSTGPGPSFIGLFWGFLKVIFFTMVFVLDFLLHAAWVKDGPSPISGGAGVELWPRQLCYLTFDLDDIKAVKNKLDATINDVLVGIVTSGLAKYFAIMSPKDSRKKLRITGLSMVDIRRTPGIQNFMSKIKEGKAEWGNRIGYVLLPLWAYRSISDPQEYVRQAKDLIGQKKQSLEAKFSYHGGSLIMSILGPKVATMLNYRVVCNTSFSLSNVAGPNEMIMFGKNPILSIRITTSSMPHALICHLNSYNGKAYMQLMLTKDIIHDPTILTKCFTASLSEMKASANPK